MKRTGISNPYFAMNAWKRSIGLPEEERPKSALLTLDEAKSNWSDTFIILMKNRRIMGAYRYGLHTVIKKQYDCIGSAIKRLQKYQITGNTEYLVDAANLCSVEFEEGQHPNKHFSSIDDGEHTQIKK